jgi:hypothetical protein
MALDRSAAHMALDRSAAHMALDFGRILENDHIVEEVQWTSMVMIRYIRDLEFDSWLCSWRYLNHQ